MTLFLEKMSASEIGEAVNKKMITPTEVVNYFYERIQKRNPSINAFVYTRIDEARARAKALEERLGKGEYLGPFAGVPFAMKDFLPSKKGWTNSKGGVESLIEIDDHDSEFTKAMEKAGGIAIGKTNAPSYGFRATTDNRLYGPSRNPFNPLYNTGGSSGGSAAAVADGLVPIAEGGDAGGSIRVPASWNNLFGFKASLGSVPNVARPDAWSASHPYCCGGGLTKTVQDAAILANLMIYFDPRDPFSFPRKKVDFLIEKGKGVKGMRIAFTYDFDLFEVEEEIKGKILSASNLLKEAGAIVEPVHFNFHYSQEEMAKVWSVAISADTAVEFELRKQGGFDIEKHKADFPSEFLDANKKAIQASLMDIYHFNCVRTDIYDAFVDIFEKYDAIISPVAACGPVLNENNHNTLGPKSINGRPVDRLIGYCETFLCNFSGHPAASIPVGFSEKGLPIGMQIIGNRYKDEDVFRIAFAMEEISPWTEEYARTNLRKI